MSNPKRLSLKHKIFPILRLRPAGGEAEPSNVSQSKVEPQDGKASGEGNRIEHQDGKGGPESVTSDSGISEDIASGLRRLSLHAGDIFNYGAVDGSIHPRGSDDKAWKHECTWAGIPEAGVLERPVEPSDPLFGFLYMNPVQGLDLYPIDVEGLQHYAGAIPGTVSLLGFAEHCADHERCFGSPMNMKILLARNDPPAVNSERIIKQLLYYQQTGGGRELGVNEEADYADLTDFLVYDHTTWTSSDDKYKLDTQTTELYAWINRPDCFCNPAGHSSMAYAMHAPAENGGIGQTNFNWQMILGYEALRRHRKQLMSIPGFTMPVRSTLDIADKLIRNVKIVIKDRPDIYERYRDPGQSPASELLEDFNLADVQQHSRVLDDNLKLLLKFAEILEWPYIDDVRTESAQLWPRLVNGEVIDAHVWDWIYGLFLPGRYAINKIMNVLILLSPKLYYMNPSATYESGIVLPRCSYWRSRTPLGTLFAAMDGVNEVCGWVGPCPPVFNSKSPQVVWVLPDVRKVGQRPIPPYDSAQTGDYAEKPKPIKANPRRNKSSSEKWVVPIPPSAPSKPNHFEIGKLYTSPALPFGPTQTQSGECDPLYEMSVEFNINHTITSISQHYFQIKYNPVFITPPPCVKGPHAILQKSVKGCIRTVEMLYHCPGDDEGILVINAAGKGAELVARAWCIQRGRHAIVRRPETPTCFGCCLKLASSLSSHLSVLFWVN